ncbi:hypothetical protein [Vibrio sp. FJH11]
MRLKPLHTMWLTLLTTLILLVSSVVNSAPLMNLKMMQSNSMLSADTIANSSGHCGSHNMDMSKMGSMAMSHSSASSDLSVDCADTSGMVNNCCTTACSFVFVSLPVPENKAYPLTFRTTINLETTETVVAISRDLYRPPIV